MNIFIESVLNQLHIANKSIIQMLDTIDITILDDKIGENKRTIRELLAHMAVIYKADYLIMNQASEEEMERFYSKHTLNTIDEIKDAFISNFQYLKSNVLSLESADLQVKTTSWWGVTYTKYEWLLEILGHVYHHRGQLYSTLVHMGRDPNVALFE
ncbi:DinB family protein [Heyndrickxia sp. NPDC080065]|uniref:DinB family protein n=1 Tax=Heyndrickxia sp. NPDC080065 TaxID=3390568 RepID=UPI003D08968D